MEHTGRLVTVSKLTARPVMVLRVMELKAMVLRVLTTVPPLQATEHLPQQLPPQTMALLWALALSALDLLSMAVWVQLPLV